MAGLYRKHRRMQLELDFAEVAERKPESRPEIPAGGVKPLAAARDIVVTGIKATKTKASPLEKRFDKLWRQLEKKQSRNDSFDADFNQVRSWMHTELAESRSQYKMELLVQTEKLIVHIGRKSLTRWQREEVGLWIEENLELLEIHGAVELPLLARKYYEARMAMLSDEERGYIEEALDLPDDEQEDLDNDSDFDDFFDEEFPEEDLAESACDDAGFRDSQEHADFDEDDGFDERKKKRQIFDKSLVSKLFRRTAKALHPDHEQDPVIREQKQGLMKTLLEARATGNIALIFKLYRKHVNNAAIEIDLPQLQPMVDLLVQQIAELDDAYDLQTRQSPLHDWVSRCINGKTEKRRKAALQELKLDLQRDINRTRNLRPFLASLAKLKPVLEARYEEHHFSFFQGDLR